MHLIDLYSKRKIERERERERAKQKDGNKMNGRTKVIRISFTGI